ncbi:MAG: hypothetical protein ACU0AX_08645 [Roseovarius sp.]|uniref:hypothetical protein n=1 Tax=Roseovarius sp. TaxID=1486281 RepID=UPI004058940E
MRDQSRNCAEFCALKRFVTSLENSLRGTAVTRLAVADCSVPEIASISGHSLKQVTAILDAHYLSRDSKLGISAIQKLEAHEKGTKSPN